MLLKVIALFYFVSFINGRTDGEILDPCILEESGENSVCVLLRNCEEAKKVVKRYEHPQICGFVGMEPIVCCPNYAPIKENFNTEVGNGHLARTACASFYDLHLEVDSNTDNPGCIPNNHGGKDCLVSGGTLVIDFKDFKHMALVGFDEGGERNWQCGGSLISEQYVLTAAHCLYSRDFGQVKYVRLGDLNYTTSNDNTSYQDFTITKIIKHPNYTYISHYNDIALLKLNKPAVFSDFVRPACLQTQTNFDQYSGVLMVAGWGKTQYNDIKKSSQLRKAAVEVIPLEDCSKTYTNEPRKLKKGIIDEIQICAGSYDDEGNTCQGDSGGPLQLEAAIENKTLPFIIGVTAFGKACGFPGTPGVYTRVSNYVEWIEDVVWK